MPCQTGRKIMFADKKMHWPLLVASSKLSAATATGGNPGLQQAQFNSDPGIGDGE